MIRCTIEILPGGREEGRRTIGIIEIARTKLLPGDFGEYLVCMKKTPPFQGALVTAWRRGRVALDKVPAVVDGEYRETAELIVAKIGGYHRTRRGVYDLLYRALRACGLEARNPPQKGAGLAMPEPQERVP